MGETEAGLKAEALGRPRTSHLCEHGLLLRCKCQLFSTIQYILKGLQNSSIKGNMVGSKLVMLHEFYVYKIDLRNTFGSRSGSYSPLWLLIHKTDMLPKPSSYS